MRGLRDKHSKLTGKMARKMASRGERRIEGWGEPAGIVGMLWGNIAGDKISIKA